MRRENEDMRRHDIFRRYLPNCAAADVNRPRDIVPRISHTGR